MEKPENNFFDRNILIRKIIFLIALVLCLTPFVSAPIALLIGVFIAQFVGHPYLHLNQKATQILLQVSIVGLGFGMNIHSALKASKEGLLFTVASIFGTLIIGYIIGKLLKIDQKISYLISAGTAICGGSAIAAISPVIKADEKQISVALGIVFILNSIALFIFPWAGHFLNLTDTQFGVWCAIAIHDTSSVVGAASRYSDKALEIATTIKLARALWIIPLAFFSTLLFKNKESKVKIPYFIGLFVLAMLANTYFKFVQDFSFYITTAAKAGLTVTLFLIGSGLSKKVLGSVGIKPFIQGVILWLLISLVTLWAVFRIL